MPRLINVAGVFRPADGSQPAQVETVTLGIYQDETEGAPLWQETQTIAIDAQGRYSLLLGATRPDGIPSMCSAGRRRTGSAPSSNERAKWKGLGRD